MLHELRRRPGGGEASRGFLCVFLAAAAFGTHLPYLLAMPSVYHESVLWGGATAALCSWFGLRHLRTKGFGSLLGAGLLAGASALTRPTCGLGALIGVAGLAVLSWRRERRSPAFSPAAKARFFVFAGLVAVFAFLPFGYNYVRFGSFVRLPYEKHAGVAPWRLEITKKGNFRLGNLIPNARAYFDPTQIDVRPGFPYYHLRAFAPRPGAVLEHAEAYAGLPAFMTGLCLLAVLGVLAVERDRELVPLLVGGGATLASLLAFTAVAHRYGHDLFALTILLSASGALWLGRRRGRGLRLARMLMGFLLAVGIWQSLSFAYFEQEWARRWTAQQAAPLPSGERP